MPRKKHQCSSFLAPYFLEFIEYKRSQGYKYKSSEADILRFDKFLIEKKVKRKKISRELVEEWIARREGEAKRNQRNRISTLRSMSTFLVDRGIDIRFPPKYTLPFSSDVFVPYIFTHEEIGRLFKAADLLGDLPKRSCIRKVFPIIVRLLYSSGLRAGEVSRLQWRDVDMENGVLRIREGKFRKDRFIPLADQMFSILKEYADQYMYIVPEDYVFSTLTESEIKVGSIYTYFRESLEEAGIPHGGRGKGPRLHDLRHTFAVHNLQKWLIEKQDMDVNLSILVDYLGHEKLDSTQQYLHLVPAIYPEIILRMENSVGEKIRRYKHETN